MTLYRSGRSTRVIIFAICGIAVVWAIIGGAFLLQDATQLETIPAKEEDQRRENRRETREVETTITSLKPGEVMRIDFKRDDLGSGAVLGLLDDKQWHGAKGIREQVVKSLVPATNISVIIVSKTHVRLEMTSAPHEMQLDAILNMLVPVLEGHRLYHDGGWERQGDNIYHLKVLEDENAT